MLRSVFLKTLRDMRVGLVGWGLGIVVLVGAMAAVWPSVRDMPDIERFLANYPEAMRELFNVEAITTGQGFLNAELFSIMLPALFIFFAVGRGARAVAGEEEAGTLEVLLVTPVSRLRFLLEKSAALAAAVGMLSLLLFLATVVVSWVGDMDVGVAEAAVAALSMGLLGLLHGWLALAVGAATGRRALAVGVASGLAGAGYLLYVLGLLVESLGPWRPLSPFDQALRGGPLGGGLQASYAWLGLAAIVALAVATPVFDRRDVAAH
jgi:ABC-2 type transport system permease protein